MSAYAQLLTADAVRDAARNQGTGGAGAAIGVGLGMAQQLAGAAGQGMRSAASPPPLPPSTGFFIGVDGKTQGPFDLAALAQRAKDGVLRADTLVWREGMAAWAAASQVPDVATLLGAK
jgi:hypothetical protein